MDYLDTFLGFVDIKVDYKLPARRLPPHLGSPESTQHSVRSELVERVRFLTALPTYLEFPDPAGDPLEGPPRPSSTTSSGTENALSPSTPWAAPGQPRGLDTYQPLKLPGRHNQTGRGGRHVNNWDLEVEVAADHYLPEKYRTVAVLSTSQHLQQHHPQQVEVPDPGWLMEKEKKNQNPFESPAVKKCVF